MAETSDAAATTAVPSLSFGVAPVKKRGRKPAQFWVSFTALDEPYKLRTAPCRHCAKTVNYHKKWEQAKSHLMKCEPFLKSMQAVDARDRPEWFAAEVERRRRSTARLLPLDLLRGDGSTSDTSGTNSRHASAERLQGLCNQRGWLGMNGMSASELLVLQAMRRGEGVDQELLEYVLAHEPGEPRTMRDVVKRLHERVKSEVNAVLHASTVGMSVMVVAWDGAADDSVEYRIAKDDKCYFLERQRLPESPRASDTAGIIEWLVEDVKRALESVSVPVAHCVLDLPVPLAERVLAFCKYSPVDDATAIKFRPSACRWMADMVNDLLQQSSLTGVGVEEESPLAGWLDVAVACMDVQNLFEQPPSPIGQSPYAQLDNSHRLVAGARLIRLADAFRALAEAESLLDVDAVRDRLATAKGLDDAAIQQVCAKLASDEFTVRLRQSISVVGPLARALAVLRAGTIHASDLVATFETMRRHYKEDTSLSERHKEWLTGMLATYELAFVDRNARVAHLLDPVFVGELLDDDTKAQAELELVAAGGQAADVESALSSDKAKQEVFAEYTQFQVAAVQLRTSADRFVFRMLKQRVKSVLQYWLTDGRKWPRLQAIALAIEQAPVDAASPPTAEAKQSPMAATDDDAMSRYICANAPLLAIADLLASSVGDQQLHESSGRSSASPLPHAVENDIMLV